MKLTNCLLKSQNMKPFLPTKQVNMNFKTTHCSSFLNVNLWRKYGLGHLNLSVTNPVPTLRLGRVRSALLVRYAVSNYYEQGSKWNLINFTSNWCFIYNTSNLLSQFMTFRSTFILYFNLYKTPLLASYTSFYHQPHKVLLQPWTYRNVRYL